MSVDDKSQPAAPKPTAAELRAEIQQTRAELGETVQALAAKADVKARAKDQVELTKQKVRAQAVEATDLVRAKVRSATDKVNHTGEDVVRTSPVPLQLVVAGVVAIVGVILIVRGRRR
jgi:ElaB/YqjD/DUF883 family membrane-anchored ribosome-binding protein